MGLLYCFDCQTIYDKESLSPLVIEGNKFYLCPKSDCQGELAEIDEAILPAIRIFNDKGYYTEFCCSGHVHHSYSSPYIKFENPVKTEDVKKLQNIYLRESYKDYDPSKDSAKDMLDYADEEGLGWSARCYQDNLLRIGNMDSLVKPFNWEHELSMNTQFEMARRMAVDLRFYGEIPCFSENDSPNPEENWWYPQRDRRLEQDRIKKLYKLFYDNLPEDKKLTTLQEFRGVINYNPEEDSFSGFNINSMLFLLDVYGAFAWDGTILLRGKEIHTAANEDIKNSFSEETAREFLKGKEGLYKHEYEAVVHKVWAEELVSITSFASILDDFGPFEEEDEEVDPEKCVKCEHKDTCDAYKIYKEEYGLKGEYQDTDDDECFDEFEGLDEIDPNKDEDEDDWNLST